MGVARQITSALDFEPRSKHVCRGSTDSGADTREEEKILSLSTTCDTTGREACRSAGTTHDLAQTSHRRCRAPLQGSVARRGVSRDRTRRGAGGGQIDVPAARRRCIGAVRRNRLPPMCLDVGYPYAFEATILTVRVHGRSCMASNQHPPPTAIDSNGGQVGLSPYTSDAGQANLI